MNSIFTSSLFEHEMKRMKPKLPMIIILDDVSCLDYLTRLRLSKILDMEDKWTILANHLGCGHMVEFIRVCLDESSSPTMMLLDQYEVRF